jgi:hypothetical protein
MFLHCIDIIHDKPLYDYQQIIFDSLFTGNGNANKDIWIKKATGLGIAYNRFHISNELKKSSRIKL